MQKIEILNLTDWQRWSQALTTQFKYGKFKPFEIEIKDIKDSVSRNQQSYLYSTVYPLLKQGFIDAGYDIRNMDIEDFDYFMRKQFYSKRVVTSKGEEIIPKRLCFGKGKKDEVSVYIDQLLRVAAKIGCYIPSPTN